MRRVRLGLVGAGSIASWQHLPVITTEVPELKLVAICSRSPDRLAATADRYRIPAVDRCTDAQVLIDRADIDALLVAASPAANFDIVMRAAAAGKHLFVEKPMAETSDQARAMAEAAEKANVVLQIGFNKRFYYAYREAARLIREGHIRRPTGIDARFVFPPSARRRLSPLHQVLLQNGIHFLDLVQALMGPAREINARALESEDRVTVAATLLFEGGEVGALLLSSCGSWSYPSERVDVLGSNGSTLSAENGRKLTLFRESQPALYLERTLSAHWLTGHDEAGFTPQLKAFARSVLDGDSVAASARDGVTALLVAESIETSIAVGQTVTIPPFDGPARVGPAGAA